MSELLLDVAEGKRGEPTTGRRVHLDVMPTDRTRDREVERLLGIGATVHADHRKADGTDWVTMADPEGNLFLRRAQCCRARPWVAPGLTSWTNPRRGRSARRSSAIAIGESFGPCVRRACGKPWRSWATSPTVRRRDVRADGVLVRAAVLASFPELRRHTTSSALVMFHSARSSIHCRSGKSVSAIRSGPSMRDSTWAYR